MVKVEESFAHARWSGDERSDERNMDMHLPSVPNLMLEDPVIEGQQGLSRNMALHANTITMTPSVASTVREVLLQVLRLQNDGRWPTLSAETRHHFRILLVDLVPRPLPRQARNTS